MLRIAAHILGAIAAAASEAGSSVATRLGHCPREERLRAWADQLGLRFEAVDDVLPDEPYAAFSVFVAESQTRLLTLTGSRPFVIGGREHRCRLLIGDIRHQEEDQTDEILPWWCRVLSESSIKHFSYLLVRLPFEDVPSLRIRHRRCPGGTGPGVTLGHEELQFEWNEFNRQVQVASADKRFGSDLIWKRMMEFLFEHPAWPIAIERGWICMTDFESQWTPAEYRNSLDWLEEFLGMWPEHLVAGLTAQRST